MTTIYIIPHAYEWFATACAILRTSGASPLKQQRTAVSIPNDYALLVLAAPNVTRLHLGREILALLRNALA